MIRPGCHPTFGLSFALVDRRGYRVYSCIMEEIIRYPHCFVCGDKNATGLQARFYWDGAEARTEIEAERAFEGYKDIYHGGIISTLLDEVMIKAILAQEKFVVTVEMTVRFHQPTRVGDKLAFVGRVDRQKGRVWFTTGDARRADGTLLASASGKYVEAAGELRNVLSNSLDE